MSFTVISHHTITPIHICLPFAPIYATLTRHCDTQRKSWAFRVDSSSKRNQHLTNTQTHTWKYIRFTAIRGSPEEDRRKSSSRKGWRHALPSQFHGRPALVHSKEPKCSWNFGDDDCLSFSLSPSPPQLVHYENAPVFSRGWKSDWTCVKGLFLKRNFWSERGKDLQESPTTHSEKLIRNIKHLTISLPRKEESQGSKKQFVWCSHRF